MAEEKEKSTDLRSQISEAMKKVVLTGVGTIFLTEETIRNYLSEFKLPKELWAGFLENAAKTKAEFLNAFAKEAAGVLSRIDFASEARKFLEGQRVRVNIELRFERADDEAEKRGKGRAAAEPSRGD